MSIILKQEIEVVKTIKGEPFYNSNIDIALENAQNYAKENNGFVAPMHLLLRRFPHDDWYTANTEDISGSDKEGKFVSKNEPVVITLHGGIGGGGLLPPKKIKQALELYRKKKGGLNKVYAAILADLYPEEDVVRELLRGNLPDSKIDVFSYEQELAGENKEHLADFRRHAIVRPYTLARQTDSGYKSISRLVDDEGRVKDSQVIVYAGGIDEGQNVIDNARKSFESGNLGVHHPFNLDNFDPGQDQARVVFLGGSDLKGLYGNNLLINNARFVGVKAPEALGAREISTGRKGFNKKQFVDQLYQSFRTFNLTTGVTKKRLGEIVNSCLRKKQ